MGIVDNIAACLFLEKEQVRNSVFHMYISFNGWRNFNTLLFSAMAVFLILVFGCGMLAEKRYKDACCYIFTMILSAISVLLIFPGMWHHFFGGYRGEEAFSNLLSPYGFIKDARAFWNFFEQLTGEGALIFLILLPLLYLLLFGDRKRVITCIRGRWGLLVIPFAGYYLTVSEISIARSSRFMVPVLSTVILLCFQGIYSGTKKLFSRENGKRECARLFAVAALLGVAFKTYEWTELYTENAANVKQARALG